MKEITDILHSGNHSCVIRNGVIRTFSQRGVADLYFLLGSEPEFLKGSSVADKVVGKGAAALMVLGGIKELYADVISSPALILLIQAGIEVSYGAEVTSIRNRSGTGPCPLESRCAGEDSPEQLLPVITDFIRSLQTNPTDIK